MIVRTLKLSGVAALLFAGVLGSSQPAAAQCGGCGGYAYAPVVVPYIASGCGCGGCGCGGSAYYSGGYAYPGYGAAGAYALDYGYAPSVVVGAGYYGRRAWRRGYWGY